MLTRRTLIGTGAALPVAAGLGDAAAASAAGRPDQVVGSFVSTPDLFNGDVGDLRTLPNWDGRANSINDSWRRAIDDTLGAVAAHRPDAVLVAGDLVEGRWNIDSDRRMLFGPVLPGTDPLSLVLCRRAITKAGGVYYGHYRTMFERRGLTLLPAVGDHEILDDRSGPDLNNRWSPSGRIVGGPEDGRLDNRYHLVRHAKTTWADHFTRPGGVARFDRRPRGSAAEWTAYAVDLGPALTVITVDEFTVRADGVRLGVFGAQLEWLRRTIREAKRRNRVVVVQGHVPIIAPVRYYRTGRLRLPEGTRSTLYRALAEEGADLYLCGEAHDTTVHQQARHKPVQVTHGSIFRYAFNYVHGQVYGDRTVVLSYYEMTVLRRSRERGIWSTDARKRQSTMLEYAAPELRGVLALRDGEILVRNGKLAPYSPAGDRLAYRRTLAPEIIG